MHNERVPAQKRLTLARTAAVATVAVLGLAGCSKGGDAGGTPSPSSSPSPSTTVSIPAGQSLTDQGSTLGFGDSATVVFEPTKNTGTVLKLTVESAQQGRLADFKGFILDDSYKQKASYYYVKVKVENVGTGDVGGVPVPLWGVNGDNTLLPAVNFTTTFPKCPSKALPSSFGAGDSLDTCLVYLSPDRGTLESVSYRPSQEFNPITWKGSVASPTPVPTPTKKPAKKKG